MTPVFDAVLIANRGEIAVRVIRTLRRLGVRSIAVFSDADAGSRHVLEADIAVRLGPAPASESYLHIGRLLDAARETGAEAVHPGYGFLAENAAFARACGQAGLAFVGPSPHAIEVMGDKIRAKQVVAAAGVPVVPGRAEKDLTDTDLVAAAAELGYPVLVKPSAGGGGKGMRMVGRPDDLPDALRSARREARSAFGDDTLFIERLIIRPRHVEVQILADAHGRTVHLGERECSLQRRQQKIVEEAPAPRLDPATRARIGDLACSTAQSVGYSGAGTVEFIVGADRPEEFLFMEMNTRLQVEHPVTELVTGLDLVEQQLRVAAGEPLAFEQHDVHLSGHALEARIYAEDPSRGFLPTGGRVLVLEEPSGPGVRVDSSLLRGLDVATTYDPMVAKVVAWGPDRTSALSRLDRALAETVILGCTTNLSLLRALLRHPDVLAGRLDTDLVERDLARLCKPAPTTLAHGAYALQRLLEAWPSGPIVDPWDVPSGWRIGGVRATTFELEDAEGAAVTVRITGTPSAARVGVGDHDEQVASIRRAGDGSLVTIGGTTHHIRTADDGSKMWIAADGVTAVLRERASSRRTGGAPRTDGEIRSPMPGTVIALDTGTGLRVTAGQAVVVVEAMKMEHSLIAPGDGIIELFVGVGDHVELDEIVGRLVTDEEEDPDDAR